MSLKTLSLAAALAALSTPAAFAGDLRIEDAYARAATPTSMSGAAFMRIVNDGAEDDRLIAARTESARRVELHTHVENADGVMRMVEIEEGIPVPAGGTALLARGGDHVMLMGLTGPLVDGESITLTLVFEAGGEETVTVPVDLSRRPGMAHGSGG